MAPTLNIKALEQTKASIRDTTKPFHIGYWNRCIYAHAVRVLGIRPCTVDDIEGHLGLTLDERSELFWAGGPNSNLTRDDAIARIDALIASRAHVPQPEPELVTA